VSLRRYRLNTLRMVGLGVIVTSFLMAQPADAVSSAVPVVQSVASPQMAGVLASTRNASQAAAVINRNGTTASSSGTYAGAGGSVTARSSRSAGGAAGGAGAATGTYPRSMTKMDDVCCGEERSHS
jgi:hypothetical protein